MEVDQLTKSKPNSRDLEKIVAGILFILQEIGEGYRIGHHALFKVMYFADRKKLSLHGIPIFKDWYVKMPFGPVPSWTRDLLTKRNQKGFGFKYQGLALEEALEFHTVAGKPKISARIAPELKFLAPKDVSILKEVLADLDGKLDDEAFVERTLRSHDQAWEAAEMNQEISTRDMIVAGGGGDSVLSSFDEREELENLLR